ncbi:MAG: alpha/beta hydrolase [Clostridia bacterium]|nr:alpha/beta hydrolase [Clostridia bacterium]
MKLRRVFAALLTLVLLCTLWLPAGARHERPDVDHPFDNSAFAAVGDYRIHYRTFPAENARGQIFMIHGFALSSYCFVALAEELVKAGYTCVLADLPDFGYSTREDKNTDQLPREEIMHGVMTSINSDPWIVAGHSMGGYVALELALQYPDDVAALLMYGTCGNDGAGGIREKMMNSDLLLSGMGNLLETMAKSPALVRLLYIFACNSVSYAMHYDVSKIIDPYYIRGTGEGALRNFLMLPATDYDAVRRMQPFLFVNGDHDYVVTDSARKNLRAALPQGSVDYVVKGGGHMCIETHAEEVANVTVEFLANH